MYLCPIPVKAQPTAVDWGEFLGTWGIFALLAVSVYFEYHRYQRDQSTPVIPSWQRED